MLLLSFADRMRIQQRRDVVTRVQALVNMRAGGDSILVLERWPRRLRHWAAGSLASSPSQTSLCVTVTSAVATATVP
jgi:hypothetical protein